jgi:hypothetical protein
MLLPPLNSSHIHVHSSVAGIFVCPMLLATQIVVRFVASRPRIGYRQQPIHVSQVVAVAARWRQGGSGEVVARWWRRGGGEVVAFRRQNQVRQLKDTWPLGFLCL